MSLRSLSLWALAFCLIGVGVTRAQEESPSEAEAKHRYQVALVAIKAGDFKAAEEELEAATRLLPSNSMLLYNLAVVQSNNDHDVAAIASLKRARDLGLPSDTTEAVATLSAELDYRARKAKDQAAVVAARHPTSRTLAPTAAMAAV